VSEEHGERRGAGLKGEAATPRTEWTSSQIAIRSASSSCSVRPATSSCVAGNARRRGALPGLIDADPCADGHRVEQPPDGGYKAANAGLASIWASRSGIYVRPGEVGVRYPFQRVAAAFRVGFGADLKYEPTDPTPDSGRPAKAVSKLPHHTRRRARHIVTPGLRAATGKATARGSQWCRHQRAVTASSARVRQQPTCGDVPLGSLGRTSGILFVGSAGPKSPYAPHMKIAFLSSTRGISSDCEYLKRRAALVDISPTSG